MSQFSIPKIGDGLPLPFGRKVSQAGTVDTSTVIEPPESGPSSHTEQLLAPMGWQPGDPVPKDLPKLMAELKKEALLELASTAKTPEDLAKISKLNSSLITIPADLPETQQNKLKAALQALKGTASGAIDPYAELQAKAATMVPPVVAGADRLVWQKMAFEQLKAEYDEANGVATPEVTPEVNKPTPQQAVASKFAELIGDTEAAKIPPAAHPGTCPCCNWDLTKAYDLEITDIDKEAFLAAWLTAKRFVKTVSLFNGKALVSFGTLTCEENELIHRELSLRVREGTLVGNAAYLDALREARLVLGVRSIMLQGNLIFSAVELDAWDSQPYRNEEQIEITKLPAYSRYFYDQLRQESLRRVLGDQHLAFERMFSTLELRVNDANFW